MAKHGYAVAARRCCDCSGPKAEGSNIDACCGSIGITNKDRGSTPLPTIVTMVNNDGSVMANGQLPFNSDKDLFALVSHTALLSIASDGSNAT